MSSTSSRFRNVRRSASAVETRLGGLVQDAIGPATPADTSAAILFPKSRREILELK
jgi:hypothetical protein